MRPSKPRLGTRCAKIDGNPMLGPYFSSIFPLESVFIKNGPYSSQSQKLPSLSRVIPSVSSPLTSVPRSFI